MVITRLSLDHTARRLHAAAQLVHQKNGFAMSLLLLLADGDSESTQVLLAAEPGPADLPGLAALAADCGALAAIKTREGRVDPVREETQPPAAAGEMNRPAAGDAAGDSTAITTTLWWPGKDVLDCQITWIRRTPTGNLLVPDEEPHRQARNLPDPALLRAILPPPASD